MQACANEITSGNEIFTYQKKKQKKQKLKFIQNSFATEH
jgi:hypothetical protein